MTAAANGDKIPLGKFGVRILHVTFCDENCFWDEEVRVGYVYSGMSVLTTQTDLRRKTKLKGRGNVVNNVFFV